MDFESSRRLMVILVENAARILRERFGVDRTESVFFEIIDLLRDESALRVPFLAMVEKTLELRDPTGLEEGCIPRELTELVAHELRWPELRQLADARIVRYFGGDRSLAASDISVSIDEAYRNDWEDREFYKRYAT